MINDDDDDDDYDYDEVVEDDDDDDDALPVVVAVWGTAQAFAIYIYTLNNRYITICQPWPSHSPTLQDESFQPPGVAARESPGASSVGTPREQSG